MASRDLTSKENKFLYDIRRFHERFQIEYGGPPRALPEELSDFRVEFLMEELDEYIDAVDCGSLEAQFDALLDLVYVALGTAYLHGFPFQDGWDEVQRANMTKVRAASAEDSKRNSFYDVVKPRGWQPPDLARVLEKRVREYQHDDEK